MRAALYPAAEMTQEQVAECIKRIRYDYCAGTLRDTFNKFVPRPAGARIAHIRVPEPIAVAADVDAAGQVSSRHIAARTHAGSTRPDRCRDHCGAARAVPKSIPGGQRRLSHGPRLAQSP